MNKQVTKIKALSIIAIAEQHEDNETQMRACAQSCLRDARIRLIDEYYEFAVQRALKSIKYSCGSFSRTYARAAEIANS